MNLSDAIRLSSLMQGVQRKNPVVWDEGKGILYRGELRRIFRGYGEMPGEDFARDSDDVLDLCVEIEYKDWLHTARSISVREVLKMMAADLFIVNPVDKW